MTTDDAAAAKRELLKKLMAMRADGGERDLRRVGPDQVVPASFAQQRMWFLDQLSGESATYNSPYALRLTGALDVPALEASFRELFARHEALRTRFVRDQDGTLTQQLWAVEDLPVEVRDLAGPDAVAAGDRARQKVAELARSPFSLTGDPLVRVTLLRLSATEHLLVVNIHHVISDAWSEEILFGELAALYAGHLRGVPAQLPEVPFHYRDYSAWQYGVAARGGFERDLAYWERRLAGAPRLLDVPHDRPRPPQQSTRGATVWFELPDAATAERLDAVRAAEGATTFVVAFAAFAVLLHRLTGIDDLVVGVPVANRGRTEWERTVGLFVNTVAVRLRVNGGMSPRDVVRATRDQLLAAQDHQEVPFDKVASRVAPGRDPAFTPVFQVMCSLAPASVPPQFPGLRVEAVAAESGTAKFDLTLHVNESERGRVAGGGLEFCTDLFSPATAGRMIDQYVRVLDAFADRPDDPVAALALVEPDERPLVGPARGGAATLHGAILERGARRPAAPALAGPAGAILSHGALAARSAAAADRLRAAGVGPESTVALALDDPVDQVVWALAALRAYGRVLVVESRWSEDAAAAACAAAAAVVLVTDRSTPPARSVRTLRPAPADALPATGGPPDQVPPSAAAWVTVDPGQLTVLVHTHRSLLAAGDPDGGTTAGPDVRSVLLALAAGRPVDPAATAPAGPVPDGGPVVVLDEDLNRVPVGVVGEIHLRGDAVARGWERDGRRTAEDFRPDPSGRPGDQLLRTGQLARVDPSGHVRPVGRRRRRLSVDGVRLQPEEVESVLRGHPGVLDAAVVAGGRDEPGLVGFYVAAGDGGGDLGAALSAHLRQTLPGYEVPGRLVPLAALPRTSWGDVDHDLLAGLRVDGRDEDRGDWTRTELRLAAAWSDVLGHPPTSRHDDFFACGGHSLLAIKLVARLRNEWGMHVPVRRVLEHPVLSKLAAVLDEAGDGRLEQAIPVRPEGSPAPLSVNQENLWFLGQMHVGTALYTLSQGWELSGRLDPEHWRAALTEVVRRHETLRTRVATVDGRPVQVVDPDPVLDHELVDLTGRPDDAPTAAGAVAAQPFDLASGPLLRSRLYRLGDRRHLFVLIVHHLVFDEWSAAVFLRELAGAYRAVLAGERPALAPLPLQYADYALWQRGRAATEAVRDKLSAALEYLAQAPTFLDLPTDRPRPPVRTLVGASRTRSMPRSLLDRLRRVGAEEGATPYMVVLAVFAILLHRYSGQRDLLIGTPVADRGRPELENQIGYFVNTVVVRSRVGPDLPFREMLRAVRQSTLDGYARREVPFARLVEQLLPGRSPSHSPLVQVMFDLQHEEDGPEFSGLDVRSVPVRGATADFDLVLAVRVGDQGILAELEFNTDLFEAGTAERMLGHLEALLDSVAADPGRDVLAVPMVAPAERAALLAAAAGPEREAAPVAVHELFEAQARSTPDAVALTHGDLQVTYARLDADAEAVRRRLGADGVAVDGRVGLYLDRGPGLFAAVLGVLKAGAAYVPLDLTYPAERVRFMLDEAGVDVVLADAGTAPAAAAVLDGTRCRLRLLDPDGSEPAAPGGPSPAPVHPDTLAYVIYTSGSTGRPKGVGLSHRALANLMRWDRTEIPVRPGGAVLQFSSLGFDASFVEMFAAWQVGGRLVVLPTDGSRRDPEVVLDHLERGRVERWDSSYVGLANVVSWSLVSGRDPLLALRAVMSGGEQLQVTDDVRRWFAGIPDCVLVNQYGPSEVNRATSQRLLPSSADWPTLPPIGRPAENTQTYVLDPEGGLAPHGVPGEVHIGGANLARGYVNQPRLTAERFLPDPFSRVPGARMYRTGDIARSRDDGVLEFLGRTDDQLKLRGHRVELGEVETALRRLPSVRDAAATVLGGGTDRHLVGYVVAAGEPPPAGDLLAALAETLPDYMVPGRLMFLERLPQTPSGKLDRGRLPVPDAAQDGPRPYTAPRDDREKRLCEIWERLLGRARVGVADNFFELGGHSLLATQVVAHVRSELGVRVTISDLFDNPTVARLADVVARADLSAEPAPRVLPRRRRRHDA